MALCGATTMVNVKAEEDSVINDEPTSEIVEEPIIEEEKDDLQKALMNSQKNTTRQRQKLKILLIEKSLELLSVLLLVWVFRLSFLSYFLLLIKTILRKQFRLMARVENNV